MPLRQASVNGQPTQPAVPADRCAREIVRILTVVLARARRLNGNPLGGHHQSRAIFNAALTASTHDPANCAILPM
jgi:hypothetical protein